MIPTNRKMIIFLYLIFLNLTESSVRKVCVSKTCKRESKKLHSYLDNSVDPCDNFFDFACGNFVKNTNLNPEHGSIDNFDMLSDRVDQQLILLMKGRLENENSRYADLVRNLFNSCVHLDGVEENGLRQIKRILHSVCGGSIFSQNCQTTKYNWIKSLQKLYTIGYSPSYIITISVLGDAKNSGRHAITVDETTLPMSKHYYTNNETMQSYYDCMVDIAVIFGAQKSVAALKLQAVLEFETELAKLTEPRQTMANWTSTYNLMNIQTLRIAYSYFPWLEYIRNIFVKHKIDETEPILNLSPTYFKQLENVLQKFDEEVITNYISWQVIFSFANYLPKNVRERTEIFTTTTTNEGHESKLKDCLNDVHESLPVAIGSLYVKNYFDDESKSTVANMVQNIQLELVDVLLNSDWLEYRTKLNAISKVSNMLKQIGYPDELLNDTFIDEYYEKLIITRGNYLQTYLNITQFEIIKMNDKLRRPNDRKDWLNFAPAANVNAYYNFFTNNILIPAAILQDVFFSKRRPRYMNYGAIGFIIGHEISHGFDTTGNQFNKVGNLNNWWDSKTFETYIKKVQCFISQYDNYTVPEINMKLNGRQIVEENIADNAGLSVAYHTYKKWADDTKQEPQLPGFNYSPEQMFWISAATIWCSKYTPQSLIENIVGDFHAIKMFRVIGSFSNNNEFANDFHCSKNSKMNPENKCKIWYIALSILFYGFN